MLLLSSNTRLGWLNSNSSSESELKLVSSESEKGIFFSEDSFCELTQEPFTEEVRF